MPHIHELIDFTVQAYIVYQDKVLLIHHIKLNKWLPIGGHIELNEDPEEALFREIKEECGLDVTVMSFKPQIEHINGKFLYAPKFLDIHKISDTHRHIGMIYFLKSSSDQVKLEEGIHSGIRWFTIDEMRDPAFSIQSDVIFYSEEALKLGREKDA